MDSPVTVREARPEDARAMGRIYHESWLATYPNEEAGITVADIEALGMDSEEAAARRAEKLAHPDGKSFRYVAEIDGEVVGTAASSCIPATAI